MISYFNDNLEIIFESKSNQEIDFISMCLDDSRIVDLIRTWPNEIKIKLVKEFLLQNELYAQEDLAESSWNEYYEMYDGKFDEIKVMHITINKSNLEDIEKLGYIRSNKDNEGSKQPIGQYSLNAHGEILIIHSSPDRKIFCGDLKQHLEELAIKSEWVKRISLDNI